MNEKTEALQKLLNTSRSIVFFGGAGVSTESGIPDFRSEHGLYRQSYRFPPETILSHTFFQQHTEEFFAFYREKMLVTNVLPNRVHYFLAEAEQAGILSGIVTQNIDGLHQAAGSRRVIELHGSIHRNHCLRCGRFYSAEWMQQSTGVPHCSCGGIVKPDVVLYEESLNDRDITEAVSLISEADTLIVGGTSLSVYPAASFLRYFHGKNLVLINQSATPYDAKATLLLPFRLGEVFSALTLSKKQTESPKTELSQTEPLQTELTQKNLEVTHHE